MIFDVLMWLMGVICLLVGVGTNSSWIARTFEASRILCCVRALEYEFVLVSSIPVGFLIYVKLQILLEYC